MTERMFLHHFIEKYWLLKAFWIMEKFRKDIIKLTEKHNSSWFPDLARSLHEVKSKRLYSQWSDKGGNRFTSFTRYCFHDLYISSVPRLSFNNNRVLGMTPWNLRKNKLNCQRKSGSGSKKAVGEAYRKQIPILQE